MRCNFLLADLANRFHLPLGVLACPGAGGFIGAKMMLDDRLLAWQILIGYALLVTVSADRRRYHPVAAQLGAKAPTASLLAPQRPRRACWTCLNQSCSCMLGPLFYRYP